MPLPEDAKNDVPSAEETIDLDTAILEIDRRPTPRELRGLGPMLRRVTQRAKEASKTEEEKNPTGTD